MTQIFYFEGLIVEESIQAHYSEALNNLKAGLLKEVRFEKKTTPPGSPDIYSIRIKGLERGTRLLFTPVRYKGTITLLFLERVANHRYHTSRFLNGSDILRKYIEDFYQDEIHLITDSEYSASENIIPEAVGEALESIDNESALYSLGCWFKKTLVKLDDHQTLAFRFSIPRIIKGTAGSGKSLVLLNLLKKARHVAPDLRRIVCLTSSTVVLNEWKENWEETEESQVYASGVSIVFKTILEWVHEMDPSLATRDLVVGFNEFSTWYLGKYKIARDGILASANLVYQEMRICSGYDKAEYLALDDNASLIPKANQPARNAILQILKAWRGQVMSQPRQIDLSFVNFAIKNRCDLLFIDEAPDLSQGLIRLLLRYCQPAAGVLPHFIFAGDEMQRLHDARPIFPYIKGELFKIIEKNPAYGKQGKGIIRDLFIELPISYRLFHGIEGCINQIQDCHRRLLGRSSKKQYSQTIRFDRGPGSRPGRVDWLSDTSELVINEIKNALARYPNLVIITLSKFVSLANTLFNTDNVLALEDFKGLERDVVVLWRCFEDPELIKASQVLALLEKGQGHAVASSSRKKSLKTLTNKDASYLELLPPISRLYVLFTRALKRLIILNKPGSNDHQLAWLYQRLQSSIIKHENWRALEEDLQVVDLDKAWTDYVVLLIRYKQILTARQLYNTYLADKSPTDFDAFLSLHNQRIDILAPASSDPRLTLLDTKKTAGLASRTNQAKSMQAQQVERLFEINPQRLVDAMRDRINSTQKIKKLLTAPYNVINLLTVNHLNQSFEWGGTECQGSFFSWLCEDKGDRHQLLLQILNTNTSILNAIVTHIRQLFKPDDGATVRPLGHLYRLALIIYTNAGKKILEKLAKQVNKELWAMQRVLLRDISSNHLDALRLPDTERQSIFAAADNRMDIKSGYQYFMEGLRLINLYWTEIVKTPYDSATYFALLAKQLAHGELRFRVERDEQRLLQDFIDRLIEQPPETHKRMMARLNELKDDIIRITPLSLIIPLVIIYYEHLEKSIDMYRLYQKTHAAHWINIGLEGRKNNPVLLLSIQKGIDRIAANYKREARDFIERFSLLKLSPDDWHLKIHELILHYRLNSTTLTDEISEFLITLDADLGEFITSELMVVPTYWEPVLIGINERLEKAIELFDPSDLVSSFLCVLRDRICDLHDGTLGIDKWLADSPAVWSPKIIDNVPQSSEPNSSQFFRSPKGLKSRQTTASDLKRFIDTRLDDSQLGNAYLDYLKNRSSELSEYLCLSHFSTTTNSGAMPIWFLTQRIDGFYELSALFFRNPCLARTLSPAGFYTHMAPTMGATDGSFFSWLCHEGAVERHALLRMILEENHYLYLIILRFFKTASEGRVATTSCTIDLIYLLFLESTSIGLSILDRIRSDLNLKLPLETMLFANQPTITVEFLFRIRDAHENEWKKLYDSFKAKSNYPERIHLLYELLISSNREGQAKLKDYNDLSAVECLHVFFKEVYEDSTYNTVYIGCLAAEFLSIPNNTIADVLEWIKQKLRAKDCYIIGFEDGFLRVMRDRLQDEIECIDTSLTPRVSM